MSQSEIVRGSPRLGVMTGAAFGWLCLVAASPCLGSAQVERWTLERSTTIGDHSDPELGLTRVGDVIVLGDRVFVAQRRDHGLRVYSLTGDLLGLIGRRGRGPGEFSDVDGMGVHNGLVWVSDGAMGRVQYFEPGGGYASSMRVRGHPAVPVGSFDVQSVLADGSMLVTKTRSVPDLANHPDRPEHVIRLDARGSLQDTVARLVGRSGVIGLGSPSGGGFTFTVLPESYRSLFAPSADGSGFVVVHREAAGSAEPHTFRVIRFDASADTAWAREIPYTPIPVSSEWRSRNLDEQGDGLEVPLVRALDRAFRKLEFFSPVGAARAGADGTTWLLVRTGADASEWVVLDPFGRSVARVETPPSGWLRWAGTDALWFLEHDELDIPFLVRYAIRRP